MIPIRNALLILTKETSNSPLPPPPYGDEIQFNDGTYVKFNNDQFIDYNTF